MILDDLSGIYLVVDGVNGFISNLVFWIFVDLNVEFDMMVMVLDGLNINKGVGLIYFEVLFKFVVEKGV